MAMALSLLLVSGHAHAGWFSSGPPPVAACGDPATSKILMDNTLDRVLRWVDRHYASGPVWHDFHAIKAKIENIRQDDYDSQNNIRWCSADFVYENYDKVSGEALQLVQASAMMDMANGTWDPMDLVMCAKTVKYKLQMMEDQPDRFYLTFQCVKY